MSTWIIGGLVALAAVLAARSIYKDKKGRKVQLRMQHWMQRLLRNLSQ